MSPGIIVAIGGVLLALLLAWGPVRAMLAKQDLQAECAAKRARLSVMRTQGGSVDEQARLEAELRDCQEAMRSLGIEVDELGELVAGIQGVRIQIGQEWTHFKSTDYSDILKRGMIRGTILRLGEELAGRYMSALEVAQALPTPAERLAALQRLRLEVEKDAGESSVRRQCYLSESPGCARYLGSTEDDRESKAAAELARVTVPLRAAREAITEAILEDGGQAPASTAARATGATGSARA